MGAPAPPAAPQDNPFADLTDPGLHVKQAPASARTEAARPDQARPARPRSAASRVTVAGIPLARVKLAAAIGVAVVLVPLAIGFAGMLFRGLSNRGELVVKVDDPRVEWVVKQDGEVENVEVS